MALKHNFGIILNIVIKIEFNSMFIYYDDKKVEFEMFLRFTRDRTNKFFILVCSTCHTP